MRPGRVWSVGQNRIGWRIAEVEVCQDAFDDIGTVDECNDPQGGAAIRTLEWVDLVNFLNQPGPVGLAPGVGSSRMIDAGVLSPLSASFLTPRERLA